MAQPTPPTRSHVATVRHHYDVTFKPEVDVIQMRRQLLGKSFRQQFGDESKYFYDAHAALYTTHSIGDTVTLRIDHGENPTTSYEISLVRNTNAGDPISDESAHKAIAPIQKFLKDSPQLVFNTALKEFCKSIPLQVVASNILTHKKGEADLVSMATKVAIQMSMIISGCRLVVKLPIKGVMVIGFDVSHGEEHGFYGGCAASMEQNSVEELFYCGGVRHESGAEISKQLLGRVEAAVKMFM